MREEEGEGRVEGRWRRWRERKGKRWRVEKGGGREM